MDRWEKGMLVKALAGHDKDRIYVISDLEGAYVYLVDGCLRTWEHPKKKKKKHVQLIRKIYDIHEADDEKISQILREYQKQETDVKEDV